MTKNKMTRLKNKIRNLTDALGDLKEDKRLVCESIAEITADIKLHYKLIKPVELSGEYYRSVFSKHKRTTTDWQALAMSFKPTKRRIKKFTTEEKIERLSVYEI